MNRLYEFTEQEQELLSDGLIALIQNAGDAKKLVHDTEAQASIDKYISRLQELNHRICTE